MKGSKYRALNKLKNRHIITELSKAIIGGRDFILPIKKSPDIIMYEI